MKTNAIIRIIIWSLVIVVLVGILASGMLGWNWNRNSRGSVEATMVPVPITEPVLIDSSGNGTAGIVTIDLNIRSSPSTLATSIGVLNAGSHVEIVRQEYVDGETWAFITHPEQGWIVMEYVDISNASIQETMVSGNEPGEKTSFAASAVSELEIDWVAGEILIQPGNSDQITVREDNVSDEKYAMKLQHKGHKLKISFCEESVNNFIGFGSNAELSKDLTITVPRDWICESLDIECASATVEVNDLTIREVDFDGASGTCEFENCTVEEIDIDTASGDVRFIGSLDILDCDAASASVYAVLSNTPSRVDVDTMSGDLDITLPEDTGFTVTMDGVSSDFSSDFETTMKNGNQVHGDGRCRINVDAMSGDVILRKGEPSPAENAIPTLPVPTTTP